MVILASRSPRRQALLRAAGVEFRVVAPGVEERPADRRVRAGPPHGRRASPPHRVVREAALAKARSVAARKRSVVLGADTIAVCEGEVLGKPRDERDARRMLRKLSGKWHRVYTGVALVWGSQQRVAHERTEVAFRTLSKREIGRYVATGEPMDKAGAYAIQGEGAGLVRAMRGCYTNVIGLPIPRVMQLLAELHLSGGCGATPQPVKRSRRSRGAGGRR